MKPPVFQVADLQRFWSKVEKRGPDQCWSWKAGTDAFGYGRFTLNGENWPAHRLAWLLVHGPTTMCVLHRCDNPRCVNAAAHLFEGTRAINVADMIAKGRARKAHGELHPSAKLTAYIVRRIRDRHHDGESHSALAREFGVTHQSVRAIVSRRTWKHV